MRRAKIHTTFGPAVAGHTTPAVEDPLATGESSDAPAVATTTQLHRVVGGPFTDLENTETDEFPQHRDDELVDEAAR